MQDVFYANVAQLSPGKTHFVCGAKPYMWCWSGVALGFPLCLGGVMA